MKKMLACFSLVVLVSTLAVAQSSPEPARVAAAADQRTLLDGLKSTIERYLGRRYVWGATGIKSFDCSGFIWRVLYENGILMKRTTARKLYMMLPPVPKEEQWNFGTLIFFDDLTHVGIVDSPEAFYHAQVIYGTERSQITPFWRHKIYGFRHLPTSP
jgi:cell wall-associated NlpC family hydrolase